MADFEKVGLLTVREKRILLCRKKHGTKLLIVPGGCYEAGESAEECLDREIREELGEVRTGPLEYIGTYFDQAAIADHKPPKTVSVELYLGDLIGEPSANSEIKELVWFGPSDDRTQLSPSLKNKIVPDLIDRGILPWPRRG